MVLYSLLLMMFSSIVGVMGSFVFISRLVIMFDSVSMELMDRLMLLVRMMKVVLMLR